MQYFETYYFLYMIVMTNIFKITQKKTFQLDNSLGY